MRPPAVATDTNGVSSYEVERILAQRGAGARRELLVRWKGYGAEDDQWQPRGELVAKSPAVAEFDALQQGGSGHAAEVALNQLTANRPVTGATERTVRAETARTTRTGGADIDVYANQYRKGM